MDVSVSFKSDGSPLTAADTETDRLLRRRLFELCPEAGWLSEETVDDRTRLGKEAVWVVDSLDGTKEFVRGVPECGISVGLVRNQEVVAGGVVNPIKDEGGVATASGKVEFWGFAPLDELAGTHRRLTASVSRSEVEDGSMTPYLRLFDRTIPVGSVAYKLLRVAAGIDDLTFSVQPKSEWDVCGGVALIQAVGKVYRRIDGCPVYFNQPDPRIASGAAAGPLELVQEVVERIGSARND
jgi:myo-inositol-1(or 4)-monophosphatase